MNYANMIEERKLKKGFIIATLISTIAGTFTTSINLYDRIIEKRKQARLDRGQDQKIRALERRVDEVHGSGRGPQRGGDVRPGDLRESLDRGGPLVQREYDQYAKLDPRFAQGDLTAQLQLQSQIITLQSTVIKLLEEALFTGKPPDISKLYNASEFAREGSIRALRDQYRRMLEGAPSRRPSLPVRRISSTPTLHDRDSSVASSNFNRHRQSGSSKALTKMGPAGPLFCGCAQELQQTGRAVEDLLVVEGDSSYCSGCGASLRAARHGSWKIEKEVAARQEHNRDRREMISVAEIRTFALTGRFLVKCHREGTGFACYLCYRHRDRDTVCPGVESLVSHVAEKHYIAEYLDDPDIKEAARSLPIR